MNNHDVVGPDSVAVDFYHIGAIFLGILLADSVGRQLARFTAWHEAGAEFESQDRAADKATALDAYYLGHALVAIELRQVPTYDMEGTGVFEGGSKVFEQHPLGREVLYIADF